MTESRAMGWASFYTGLTGLLLILIFAIAEMNLRSALLGAIALALILPLAFRTVARSVDLFEPLVLTNTALAVMFIGRPLMDLISRQTVHLGYDVLPTFNAALGVALVGVVFFQIGYALPVRAVARFLPTPTALHAQKAALAGWTYLILGATLFIAFLNTQGGVGLLFVLLKGQQQSNNDLFLGSSGYLYNGLLMWGASALIFFALAVVAKRRVYWLWFSVPTFCLLIFYGARGTRSNLLPLVLAIPIFWYLWKGSRPRMRTLLVATIIGVTLLSWLREVRRADADRDFTGTLVNALSSPGEEALSILGGGDADMFDALANSLLVVPNRVPFHHGAVVTDVLVRAVPRPLWPNKPLESNDAVVTALWPEHYAKSRGSPAFSLIGSFYADSGYLSVALGMLLVGAFLRTCWHWFQRYRAQPIAQMIYAMGLPFVIVLMRGTVPDTLTRMLFLFAPLVLLMLLARVRISRRTRPTLPRLS